jgi:hypothetical protein
MQAGDFYYFFSMVCTAAESCELEPLKEPAIYALCERKEGNPIWTWRIDLQDCVKSKGAADNLLRKSMAWERNKMAKFFSAKDFKEEPESGHRELQSREKLRLKRNWQSNI